MWPWGVICDDDCVSLAHCLFGQDCIKERPLGKSAFWRDHFGEDAGVMVVKHACHGKEYVGFPNLVEQYYDYTAGVSSSTNSTSVIVREGGKRVLRDWKKFGFAFDDFKFTYTF